MTKQSYIKLLKEIVIPSLENTLNDSNVDILAEKSAEACHRVGLVGCKDGGQMVTHLALKSQLALLTEFQSSMATYRGLERIGEEENFREFITWGKE